MTQTSTAKGAAPAVKVLPLFVVLLSGAFVAILNETVLNVALNRIMVQFDVAYSTVQWLVTGYMLVIGTLIPVSAYLMERFTTRQLFISAMTFFTIGTIISGISPVFAVLLIGRLTQALGTALIIPLLTNIILTVIPLEKRGGAMGLIGLVITFAPAIGPTLSGLIVEHLSWRWLFFLILPIGLFSLVLGIKVLKNVTEVTKPKLDILSFILSTLAFGGIVYGFSSAGESSFSSPVVIVSLVVGFVSLIIFGFRQLKLKTPLLDIRVFTHPMFTLGIVLMMFVAMTMFALLIVLPMYMQGVLLFSAVTTGLMMLPGGVLNGLISPFMGRLFDRFGPRPLLVPGAIMLAIVVFTYRFTVEGTPMIMVIAQHLLLMVSISMIMMPAQTNALNQLPLHLYPHGSAIANTLMQVAGAVGAALFIAITENSQKSYLAGIAHPTAAQTMEALKVGSQHSFSIGFYFACIVVILSLFVKKQEA